MKMKPHRYIQIGCNCVASEELPIRALILRLKARVIVKGGGNHMFDIVVDDVVSKDEVWIEDHTGKRVGKIINVGE